MAIAEIYRAFRLVMTGPAASFAPGRALGRALGLLLALAVLLPSSHGLGANSPGAPGGGAQGVFQIEELARAALSGDAEASYRLGLFLVLHPDDADDLAVAEAYLRFAAERNHVDAQHELGLFLIGAEETDDRIDEGLYWLGSAASLGDALSAVVLGRLHEHGLHGVRKDLCLARDWYEVGAMLGLNPPAGYLEHMTARHAGAC